MKKTFIFSGIAVLSFFIISMLFNPLAPVGKYQLTTKNNEIYLLDTKNGDVYQLNTDLYGIKRWEYLRK